MSNAKYAYAIWPWGIDTREQFIQALKDIKDAGFQYFESVKTTISLFQDNIHDFKSLMEEYSVMPVSFYFHMTGEDENDVEDVKRKMPFLAENNIHRISLQTPGISGRPANQEELNYALNTVNKVGEIAKQYGVIPCVHPHYNTTVMYENEIDFILQNTDPEYIAFGPDTAHLKAGGCDPVSIFKRYIDRVKFTHMKDLRDTVVDVKDIKAGVEVYSNFRELGEGDVDFHSLFKILKDNRYDGYLTAELDISRFSNRESAFMNMKYLKENY
jgi:Sugar phosphate isomerases/epimerases